MPYSRSIFNKTIESLLEYFHPATILDIGCGAGKYGRMAKEILPDSQSFGIEIENDYIEKFGLKEVYSNIRCMDAVRLIETDTDKNYDLVILGDSLEHLRKSDGIDLLNFLVYRTKLIIIIYPHQYLQNSVEGYKAEAHISVWTEHDFQWCEHLPIISIETQRLIIIRGYIESEIKFETLQTLLEHLLGGGS
jgi:SAM-dependent methyltransferase